MENLLEMKYEQRNKNPKKLYQSEDIKIIHPVPNPYWDTSLDNIDKDHSDMLLMKFRSKVISQSEVLA